MTKNVLKRQLEQLKPGDLICVDWCDASIGKSSYTGPAIDVPVKSWGVYLGVFGEKTKHIVVAQNSFRYSSGVFEIDFTAIPVSWAASVQVLAAEHLPCELAERLISSFLAGGRRMFNHVNIAQQRVSVHDGLG
ncbi:MAG: hypothetical protein QXL10_01005 [Candidatus Bathyarchaeia archaeon]